MSGKTSLLKLFFVFAVLGVLALVAMAPTVAGAFFQNEGVYGFTSRLLGNRMEKDTARSLRILASSSSTVGSYFEITGTLEAVDGNLWTVDGFTVVISDTTEITGTFVPGDPVKVEGTLQDDGSILASQIKSPGSEGTSSEGSTSQSSSPSAARVELIDILNSNSGEVWSVGSWSVMVSSTTEQNGSLEVGALVKVEGLLQEDGSILAHEIQVVPEENVQKIGLVELTGTLESQDGMTWIVSGIVIELSDTTEILGVPEIGAQVKVEGILQENGSILASQIKSAMDENGGDDDGSDDHSSQSKGEEVEISGELTGMDGNTWTVNDQTVIITDMTELKGVFEIGVMVKVEGYLLADGSIEAHEIKAVIVDMNGGDDDHDDDRNSSSGYSDDDDHGSSSSYSEDDHDDDRDHDSEHEDDHDGSGSGSNSGSHDDEHDGHDD